MRLTVVGCSGSIPGPGAAASCYLVEADGFALVLDLGSGAFGPLLGYVAPAQIGAVLLSHLHADHWLDLPGLVVALQHGPYVRATPVPVLGPPGPPSLLDRLVDVLPVRDQDALTELGRTLDVGVVAERTWPVGPFAVTARRVEHTVDAYAYRVEHDGRVLAYSGDCAPCAGLDDIVEGADLALVEAAFVDEVDPPAGVHHTPREAGELATRARVGRLLVTHVPPWSDPAVAVAVARAVYAGSVEAARPGATYDV